MPVKGTIRALAVAAIFASSPAAGQSKTDCPAELPSGTTCYTGQDANGAHYWIAMPAQWNGGLIVHAHGGPRLAPRSVKVSLEDLRRFAITVHEGYAWAGSSYRRPGYGVTMAAEDSENLRRLFVQAFGAPKRTILHGQSWGANVAAKGIELFGVNADGSRNYDGAMLTSGVLAGGTRSYLHRADLRAVYQYYCNNHPRPDEPQYPLWSGLPLDSKLTPKELAARVSECTGVNVAREKRSASQQQNLANITSVIRIEERSLIGHLNWATFLFRDLVQLRLGDRNPFSNRNVSYQGSSDDAALNKGVARFDADPEAVALLAKDADLTGRIAVPVITIHAINDAVAMVEYQAAYRDVIAQAGNSEKLRQVYTTEREHSKLADPQYAALLESLAQWIESGKRPAMAEIVKSCERHAAKYEGGCHFDPEFEPKPLFSRVAPR
jgi:hypothetical protein